jgi:hypothetical protein
MAPNDRAEQQLELERFRAIQRETTDPLAVRLITEIVAEIEEALEADNQSGTKPTTGP